MDNDNKYYIIGGIIAVLIFAALIIFVLVPAVQNNNTTNDGGNHNPVIRSDTFTSMTDAYNDGKNTLTELQKTNPDAKDYIQTFIDINYNRYMNVPTDPNKGVFKLTADNIDNDTASCVNAVKDGSWKNEL